MKISNKSIHIIFWVFLLLSVIVFNRRSLFYPPIAKHAWAQSDWYALSLGFLENGMDLFHPETQQLNEKLVEGKHQSITSVDCPMHPYAVAWLMKAFDSKSPTIYRSYTLGLSIVSLFLFYLAVFRFHGSVFWAMSLTAFIRFQPTYAYYMDGFLPSQHAFSLFLISLFFFGKFMSNNKLVWYTIGSIFLLLASLTRIPFTSIIIALFAIHFLASFKSKSMYWQQLTISGISLLSVLAYYIYNTHLANEYGSAFLNTIAPAKNLVSYFSNITYSMAKHFRTVLPLTHMLFITGIVYTLITSKSHKKIFNQGLFGYVIISAIGVLLYGSLMNYQLPRHDYYFNDFLFPFIITVLFIMASQKWLNETKTLKFISIFFIASSFQLAFAYQSFEYKNGFEDYRQHYTITNFDNADVFLNEQKVPRDAIMMVIGSYAPSIPFYNMSRKGFNVRIPKRELIIEAFSKDFQYIVTQNNLFYEINAVYPEWEEHCKKIASNGKISLWTRID